MIALSHRLAFVAASLPTAVLPGTSEGSAICLMQPRARRKQGTGASRTWPNWREGSIWKVGLLLGAVNASYFGLNGFLPGWLSQAGGSSMVRPALLALNAAQIPASLLMMVFVERLALRRVGYVVAGLLVLAGSVGLATAPATHAIAFAVVAGFSLGCLLTMALALPPLTVEWCRADRGNPADRGMHDRLRCHGAAGRRTGGVAEGHIPRP